MIKKDIVLSLAAAFVISIFLIPTLVGTDLMGKFNYIFPFLFLVVPLFTIIGMFIAKLVSKKIAVVWQLAKFALVGVLNTSIDFGILNFLILMSGVTSGAGIILINATSFSTALVNSFFWNKEWVFGDSKKSNFLTFAVVTLVGLSINTGVVYVLTTFLRPDSIDGSLWANMAKIAATLLSLTWNFAGYRLVVFKK